MEILIGLLLALCVGTFAAATGFDRDRAFYPVLLIVTASYEVLFAAIGSGPSAIALEVGVLTGFVAVAVAAFKRSLWWVVVALAGHGLFDISHPHLFSNPGIPPWWPNFCVAFDVVAACFVAARLHFRPAPDRKTSA